VRGARLSLAEIRMSIVNPSLDEAFELRELPNEFLCFGFAVGTRGNPTRE
jgi:hypothetical protein